MNDNFFDGNVRKKLLSHEAPVPQDAWENIQKGRKRKRPFPFFWVLLLLLIVPGGTLFFLTNHFKSESVLASSPGKGGTTSRPEAYTAMNIISTTQQPHTRFDSIARRTDIRQPDNLQLQQSALSEKFTSNQGRHQTEKSGHQQMNQDVEYSGNVLREVPKDHMMASVHKPKRRRRGGSGKKVYNAGRTEMTVQAPRITGDPMQMALVFNDQDTTGSYIDITPLQEAKPMSAKAAFDTLLPAQDTIVTTQVVAKKKSFKKSVSIDAAFNVAFPLGSRADVSEINRITTEPLRTSQFTATGVRIRQQAAACFQVMLFKQLAPKFSVGAGIGYQGMKEYIHLSGQEVNTSLSIVKRLNGSVLADDTLTIVSSGTRKIDAVNSYRFWNIPVAFRYHWSTIQAWSLDLQAGIDFNMSSSYHNSISGVLQPQFTGSGNASRNNSIGTGFNAGARIGRHLNQHFVIYMAAYLQVNPKTLYLEEMITPVQMHKTGISIGLNYALGK